MENYREIKKNIYARLYKDGVSKGISKPAKEYGFEDLVIVPYVTVKIDSDEEFASAPVTKEMVKRWGVTEDDVFDDAIDNIDVQIKGMSELLFGMSLPDDPMTVITNTAMFYGAAAVLKAKRELQEKYPNGYVILPSSVHEVLVVEAGTSNLEELKSMVETINADMVSENNKLTDNAYLFEAA